MSVNETPADIVIEEQSEPVGTASELIEEPSVEFGSAELTGAKLRAPADDVVPAAPDRPQIRLADGEQPEILAAAEKIVARHNYSRGSTIVRIAEERPGEQQRIIESTASYLATEITRDADVTKYDGRVKAPRKTNFPESYAYALLQRKEWPQLLPLDAIVHSPFVREDGSICDQPGYDPESRVYAAFDTNEFYPLDDISKNVAADALATLTAPFDEIPFGSPAALSAFIALILSGPARIATPCVPAFTITANDPAAGKSLLSRMPSIIAEGTAAAPRPWPNSPDEVRKVLFSALMAGDSNIVFDNIREGVKVRSAEVCAFTTSPVWQDRKLGESGSLALPNRSVVVFTGNNINPCDDLARRSLVIRLNPNMDRDALSKRIFRIPELESYVKRNRANLLMCALKIIKAHQQSEHVGPTPLPSFERWSRLVRDALIWLGMPDPCETQKQEADDGRAALAGAFEMLAPKLEGRKFTAADVRGVAMFDDALCVALNDGGCSEPRDSTKIGYWLRENRDRFGGDFRLQLVESSANSNSSKRYQFVRIRAAAAEEAPAGNFDLVGGAS
jgi:putative DNA primase/helicase